MPTGRPRELLPTGTVAITTWATADCDAMTRLNRRTNWKLRVFRMGCPSEKSSLGPGSKLASCSSRGLRRGGPIPLRVGYEVADAANVGHSRGTICPSSDSSKLFFRSRSCDRHPRQFRTAAQFRSRLTRRTPRTRGITPHFRAGLPNLRCKVARDVQDQLRDAGRVGVNLAVVGPHDGHVRSDRPVDRIQR